MSTIFNHATLDTLTKTKANMKVDEEAKAIVDAKEEVLNRFTPAFQFDSIGSIDDDILTNFLYFKNNQHWTGLHRQAPKICADMAATRSALTDLANESRPLKFRIDRITEIPGIGKAIATAILHVAYPDKFGVWNATSEAALMRLGVFPLSVHGATLGEQYVKVNKVLLDLSRELDVDLWTLDGILWLYLKQNVEAVTAEKSDNSPVFDGKEKSIKTVVYSVNDTVKHANGQIASRNVKVKKLLMSSYELDARVRTLLAEQDDCCSITGIPFQFEGTGEDTNFRPSLDRIDSDGHYETSNVQLVCRFINFWKQATDDDEFRRLIAVVRQ